MCLLFRKSFPTLLHSRCGLVQHTGVSTTSVYCSSSMAHVERRHFVASPSYRVAMCMLLDSHKQQVLISHLQYVLAPAQIGRHFPSIVQNDKILEGRISYGNSLIVDPWGTVLARCPDNVQNQVDEGAFAMAEIDLAWLARMFVSFSFICLFFKTDVVSVERRCHYGTRSGRICILHYDRRRLAGFAEKMPRFPTTETPMYSSCNSAATSHRLCRLCIYITSFIHSLDILNLSLYKSRIDILGRNIRQLESAF